MNAEVVAAKTRAQALGLSLAGVPREKRLEALQSALNRETPEIRDLVMSYILLGSFIETAVSPSKSSGQPFPRWAPMVGAVSAVLTLIFLMGIALVLTVDREARVPVEIRFLISAILSLGTAIAFSFLGGDAAAQGRLPIPFAKSHPVQFSVTGGIAAFFIVFIISIGGWRAIAAPGSTKSPDANGVILRPKAAAP